MPWTLHPRPVTKVYEATREGPAAGLSFADVIAAAGAYAVNPQPVQTLNLI